MLKPLEKEVLDANKEHHDRIDTESYEQNKSIFGEHRQSEIHNTLSVMTQNGDTHLDVGCGTGNVLRLSENYFDTNFGIDGSFNMLEKAKKTVEAHTYLTQGDGTRLPFPDETFDAVTFYAILHHFPSPIKFLREGARVLKPGGHLYTDHDPNYYLVRFYFPLYKLIHLNESGFGSETGDMAEFFHTQRPGIDPEELAESLRSISFDQVNLEYYQTQNPNLSFEKEVFLTVLRPLSKILPMKSFFTHFSILARK